MLRTYLECCQSMGTTQGANDLLSALRSSPKAHLKCNFTQG